MKAANSGTPCRTLMARYSITRIYRRCVIGDGEAETGAARDELALEQVSESRSATVRCCRSCI